MPVYVWARQQISQYHVWNVGPNIQLFRFGSGDAMYSGIGEVGIYTKCTNGAIFMGIKQTVLFIFQASCNWTKVFNKVTKIIQTKLFCLQNTLVIDTPRVRKQTRHFSSVKEEEMLEFSELESDEDEPSKPSSKPRRPQDKTQGYPRSECFRVEKNLLVYGSVTSSCFLLTKFNGSCSLAFC